MELSKNFKKLLSPRFSGLIIGVMILSVGLSIAYMRYQILTQYEEERTRQILHFIEQNINQAIQETYSVALTLALTVNENGEVKDFEKVAEKLYQNYNVVDILELVPNGVIEYVYPLEGNESVVGYDISNDPKVSAEVSKAAESGTMYFAGPIDLRQGERAVIGRLPIIINNELWGYSAIVIYLETLIERSGINEFTKDGSYYFQMTKVNPNTGEEEFFLPIYEQQKLDQYESMEFPEGDWKLYATRMGANQPLVSFWLILGFSFLGALSYGFLSYKILLKPFELKELLHNKSEELLESREKFKKNSELLQSILESPRGVMIFSLDSDYKYVAFTASHKSLMKDLWDVDIEVGKSILDYIADKELEKSLKSDCDEALEGKYFEYIRKYGNENVEEQYWESRFAPINAKDGSIVGLTVFITNISQKVKAEKEINLEKQLSDSIINSLPGIFYLYNKEGKFYRWNTNFEKVTGYTSEEMEKAHPIDFFDDDEKELLREKIANVFVEGEDSVEAHFLSKDGTKTPYYFTGAALNYKGEECLLGVGIDVSEQKKAERKHEEVLQQLQNHLYNSPLGVVEYDSDLNIISWSKRCEEIFGWNEQEILNKNAFDIIYEQDKVETEVIARQLSEGSVDHNISNNRNYTKSGEIIDCLWFNSVVKDSSGEILTVMSLVEDITEKKKTEAQIKQSEKRYRTLVNNTPYCIHEIDIDQRIISMNKAGLKMMEIKSEEEIIGSLYGSFAKNQDSDRITKLFQKALQGKSIEFEFELDEERYFLSSFVPIFNRVNTVERVMGITQDITERKRSEEIIENSLKEKTTLLSEIHHRVKNNLAIVSGLLELQKNEVKDEKVTAAFEQSINRIISIAMVHELMYKSPELSSINVHTYLDMLIPAISRTMNDSNNNVEFMIDIADRKLNISEAIPLGLMLNELITNSFKYAFKGVEKGVIHIDISVSGNDINVLYEDNGKGFKPDINFDQPKNLGLTLIHTQLQQLGAEHKADTSSGFRLEFSFRSETVIPNSEL